MVVLALGSWAATRDAPTFAPAAGTLGGHKGRPYDDDDSVDVVGHHHKGVHFDVGEAVGHFLPNARDHRSGLVQPHLPVHHVAEQEQTRLDDNGHEVDARLRVVVPLQPKRTAVTAARVIGASIGPLRKFYSLR